MKLFKFKKVAHHLLKRGIAELKQDTLLMRSILTETFTCFAFMRTHNYFTHDYVQYMSCNLYVSYYIANIETFLPQESRSSRAYIYDQMFSHLLHTHSIYIPRES
jgi:hypothetical protein